MGILLGMEARNPPLHLCMTSALKELPAALAEFQAVHHAAGRDSKGNYGTYTSLGGALAAVQKGTEMGLSHTQTIHPLGEDLLVLRTTLFHKSGESITSDLPMPVRSEGRGNYFQALGSAITYCRRYSLLAIYGLAGEDDEAEATAAAPQKAAAAPAKAQPKPAPAKPVQAVATPAQPEQTPAQEIVWIDPARKATITAALKAAENKDEVLAAFRKQFSIAQPRIGPDHVQTAEHGDFLEAQLCLA